MCRLEQLALSSCRLTLCQPSLTARLPSPPHLAACPAASISETFSLLCFAF